MTSAAYPPPQASHDAEDLSLQPAAVKATKPRSGPRPSALSGVPVWQVWLALVAALLLLVFVVIPRLAKLKRRPKPGKRTE